MEERSRRPDPPYSKAFKRSRGKRRRGEPVRHVAGDEQHPLLRGTPRTPVGGERLDKHGALSDGPSAALSGPSTALLWSTPATRCCGEVDKKAVPSRATLSAPYPFRFDRFNFVLMSFAHSAPRKSPASLSRR